MTSVYVQTSVCEFPCCDRPAPPNVPGWDGDRSSLCLEHDAHLFYDPAAFHRLWKQCDPAARRVIDHVATASASA